MARTSAAQYFIRFDTYWQNSPNRFCGPFASRAEAQAAIDNIPTAANVWLSTSQCGGDIRDAIRVYPTILTATEAKRMGMRNDYSAAHNTYAALPDDMHELFSMESNYTMP